MVLLQDALPGLKRFLQPLPLKAPMSGLLIRCVVAFLLHLGRISAARAATAVRSQPRHRAQLYRFLGRTWLQLVFSTRIPPTRNQPIDVQTILVTNDRHASARTLLEWYSLRWPIELFFKELKSTLDFHPYRFRQFERVEGWDELVQVTFLYLEWYRARRLQRRDLPSEKENGQQVGLVDTDQLAVGITQPTRWPHADAVAVRGKDEATMAQVRQYVGGE